MNKRGWRYVGEFLVAAIIVIAIAVFFAYALASSADAGRPADGEAYNVTFELRGDCPPGTVMKILPSENANRTVQFWRVEPAVSAEFEVIGNRSYELRLVRPGMANQTMAWRATARQVVFENRGSGECSFDWANE